jgi:biotin transport system substrate-specific component
MHGREMILSSLFAALTALGAYITVPLWPVPVTLQTFFVYLAAAMIGWKAATLSQLIYIALGLAGLPVFAGGKAGPTVFLGPTGGYIVGFVLAALIAGLIIEKKRERRWVVLALLIATGIIYASGFLYLSVWLHMVKGEAISSAFYTAFSVGVIPFIVGDLIKVILASYISTTPQIEEALRRLKPR